MKEKYMIVRIRRQTYKFTNITEECYEVVDSNYETLEDAYEKKMEFDNSHYFIITKYWV